MKLKSQIKAKIKARTIDESAERQAALLIGSHGIKLAERIANLTLQKIRASSKRLKRKYDGG